MVMMHDMVMMRRPMVMVLYMMMWNHAGALRGRRTMQMRKGRMRRGTRRTRRRLAVLLCHLQHMMMFSLSLPLEVVPLSPTPLSLEFPVPLAVLLPFSLAILSLPLFPISHHQPLPLVFFVHRPRIPLSFTRSTGRTVEVEPTHTHTKTHPRSIRLRASSACPIRKNRHRRYRTPSIHETTFHVAMMMRCRR